MHHPRFLTAVLSLSLSGGMLLGGPLLTDESQAIAAARRTVKATAGRVTRARRSNDPAGGPRRMSDASMDGAKVQKVQDSVEPNLSAKPSPSAAAVAGLSDASAPARDVSNRERNAASEKSSTAKAIEKAAAKSPPESASNTKSTPEGTKLPDGAKSQTDGAASRNADPRPSAAKAPAESDPTAASGSAPATSAPATSAPPTRPVLVTLEGPVFDGGDVPRASAALDRMKGAFARCASIESALTKNEATIDLRFLVRAPGRAEGVDVDKARGVSADVVRCMTSVLARSYIGAPSDDPVGVAVVVRLRRPEAANN